MNVYFTNDVLSGRLDPHHMWCTFCYYMRMSHPMTSNESAYSTVSTCVTRCNGELPNYSTVIVISVLAYAEISIDLMVTTLFMASPCVTSPQVLTGIQILSWNRLRWFQRRFQALLWGVSPRRTEGGNRRGVGVRECSL